jgi:hypothetical protein
MERPRQSEAQIQAAIVRYLTIRGIPHSVTDAAWRSGRDRYHRPHISTPGWPDVTCCLPGGQFLGVEVKTAKGRMRPAQIQCHAHIELFDGRVIVARHLDDVVPYVERQLTVAGGERCGKHYSRRTDARARAGNAPIAGSSISGTANRASGGCSNRCYGMGTSTSSRRRRTTG